MINARIILLILLSITRLEAEIIELAHGGTLECESATLQDDIVIVKIKSGTIRLPVATVAETTLLRLRGETTTIPSPAPIPSGGGLSRRPPNSR
ncbi:MAG: hypothetical protein ACFCUX_04020 [Candidatus Methylacidiphilales bacterium]